MKRLCIPHLILGIILLPLSVSAQVDYPSQIQPIFNSNCVSCHGGTSGVTLSSYNLVMSSVGDQYGRLIIVPGDAGDSPLYDKISPSPQIGDRMPQGGSLSDAQINLIRDWIDQGARPTNIDVPEVPITFDLRPNYPNPFNPSTTVVFSLADATHVQLTVHDILGRAVATLLSEVSPRGEHTVVFEAGNLPSGIYILRMQAGEFVSVQKMLLAR